MSLAVIGQDYSIVMPSRDYLEQTMILNTSLDNFGIINDDVADAALAPASLVLRGSVKVVAALATRLKTFQPTEARPYFSHNLAAGALSTEAALSQAG